jgi:hypothetical protein
MQQWFVLDANKIRKNRNFGFNQQKQENMYIFSISKISRFKDEM